MRAKKYENIFSRERIDCDVEGASLWKNIKLDDNLMFEYEAPFRRFVYSMMFEWPCLKFPDQQHGILIGSPRRQRYLTFNLG